MRLDLVGELVTEENGPAAVKGQPVGAALPCSRRAALAQPPLLERGEEAAAARRQPVRLESAVGAEAQRCAGLGEQHTPAARGAAGGRGATALRRARRAARSRGSGARRRRCRAAADSARESGPRGGAAPPAG